VLVSAFRIEGLDLFLFDDFPALPADEDTLGFYPDLDFLLFETREFGMDRVEIIRLGDFKRSGQEPGLDFKQVFGLAPWE
jgi:hypothetical protein